MWHLRRDIWHVKTDIVTSDTWHMTWDTSLEVNILSKCQLPISYSLGVWIFAGLEEKDHRLNQWMGDEGVCRTAPATPGLLNSFRTWVKQEKKNPQKSLK